MARSHKSQFPQFKNRLMKLNFRSDNESPAAAQIMAALAEANEGPAWAYATDDWSEQLNSAFSNLFETDTLVIPVSTGTAANSMALASVTPAWGAVYCHRAAHIYNDESGAPEFFGQGLRLVPVEGGEGRLSAEDMDTLIRANTGHGVHSYVPSAVSLTQSTECGTLYQPSQVEAICSAAKDHGMATHMDGARFGNAIAGLGCRPADVTWRAGVEMLSFGASKNGCLAAEALLIFGRPELREACERHRKRSGHLLSKMRYVSAQLLAYIEDGLWLELAGNANRQAAAFATAVERHPQASLEFPVEANEVFVSWSPEGFSRLEAEGIEFLMWPGRDDLARFVFSHCTTEEDTRALCNAM
jgi:threonine aldolase